MKVLLVEDDAMNLELYGAGLKRNGIPQINVLIVTTFLDALKALESDTWDMVISDLKLPEKPGGVINTHGIAIVREALRRGIRKVYLNTTDPEHIRREVPDGAILLPAKLTHQSLPRLLKEQAI